MDLHDLDPQNPSKTAKDLSLYSIDELKAYIELLKAELARAERFIQSKSEHKSVAASLFKE